MIAAREAAGKLDGLSFDRYVAVDPPVSLVRALDGLDDMFNAPLNWPADERAERMKLAIYKALYFAQNGLDVSGNIPLTADESKFLIGMVFRFTLMSAIVDSQRRDNLGVLKVEPRQVCAPGILPRDPADFLRRLHEALRPALPHQDRTRHGPRHFWPQRIWRSPRNPCATIPRSASRFARTISC